VLCHILALRMLMTYYIGLFINPIKRNGRLFIQRPSSYRAVNTLYLGYKSQSVYAVSGTSRCLFSHNTKHINTVWAERTVVEC